MRSNIPVEKNKKYIVDIISSGYEGEGVARLDNFTIFVHGALPGEKVEILIVKVNKNFAFGKLLNIIEESKNRAMPECSIYESCGGCQLQHYSYEAQLAFKKERITEVLKRVGKIENPKVLDVIGMENPYRYRNKVQLPVGNENGQLKIGFYAPRSHRIIDINQCLIQNQTSDKVIEIIRNWITENNVSAYNEETYTGQIRHIMIREGFHTGEVMVVIVTNSNELPFKNELIKAITENIKGIKSIVHNINKEKTNVILGTKCNTIWGCDTITDKIGKFSFEISPLSFFQVNPIQTEVLYNKALEFANLTGDEIVFDAYCGAGTISLFLAQKAKKVYGVEIVPEAIENAKQNAKLNNVNNVEFTVGESETIIPGLINDGIKPDVIVVDPPRKGCDIKLLEAIEKVSPRRMVYVSCDPATLARDLAILQEMGFEVQEVQGVDMFPETGHVESVVLITRKDR